MDDTISVTFTLRTPVGIAAAAVIAAVAKHHDDELFLDRSHTVLEALLGCATTEEVAEVESIARTLEASRSSGREGRGGG